MVWGYYELRIPPDLEPVCTIDTSLRGVGCTCRPLHLSVFSNRDPDTHSVEYECLLCHARMVVLCHSPCTPSFSPKELS
jgi:hypothetical protein